MIVYRAMSELEYQKTLSSREADFTLSRFKWFSPCIGFVLGRVCDGSFNNSKFKSDRYTRIVSFEFDDKYLEKVDYVSQREIQIDRRRNIPIKLVDTLR